MDSKRGTGRSTAQLQAAPPNAIYIIPNENSIYYFRRLAHGKLGRTDINFLSAASPSLEQRLLGVSRPSVVDHAAEVPLVVLEVIEAVKRRYAQRYMPAQPQPQADPWAAIVAWWAKAPSCSHVFARRFKRRGVAYCVKCGYEAEEYA